MNDLSLPLYEQVGFDYVTATVELLKKMSRMEMSERVGYASAGSIHSLLKGRTPSHIHGEAIWALYIEVFGCKPPLVRFLACEQKPPSVKDSPNGT